MTVGMLIGGLVLLVLGAELLVRGASRLARAVGISPLVIGLTVVAFGTSAPELAVSVNAGLAGNADVALGNVVGSNILNVLGILGLSALAAPLVVAQKLVRLDVPVMIGVSALMWIFALNGVIGRVEGLVLFAGIVAYMAFLVRQSRRERADVLAEYEAGFGGKAQHGAGLLALQGLYVAGGLALLVVGADWLVDGAVAFAKFIGISELVIGLTVVAVGTSLPELATSVVASLRGERDIAVGNIVGSNIFNLLAVLGAAAAIAPAGISVNPAALAFDIPVMVAAAVVCLPVFISGFVISRGEGALLLAYFAAYVGYLVLDSTGHDATRTYGAAMLWFALPLTAIGLIVSFGVAWRRARKRTDTARP